MFWIYTDTNGVVINKEELDTGPSTGDDVIAIRVDEATYNKVYRNWKLAKRTADDRNRSTVSLDKDYVAQRKEALLKKLRETDHRVIAVLELEWMSNHGGSNTKLSTEDPRVIIQNREEWRTELRALERFR